MTEATETKPDRVALNVAAYERVYRECLRAARRVAQADGQGLDVQKLAELFFDRYWHDQIELCKSEPTSDIVRRLGSALETRLAM